MLRILKHPNIVEFYTAFTFQDRPALLFAEAECDLKHWLRATEPTKFSEIETLEACYGLSSALHRLHQYVLEGQGTLMIGCHFDLHPGNVLVRDRSFILSDFGLSRLKYESQGSQSYFKGGIRDYYAPECQQWENDLERNKSGRPSDVWSFGCIIAEVATFLKCGSEGLYEFDQVRRIPGSLPLLGTFHDRGHSHQRVDAWIKDLSSDATKHPVVAGLANLVNRVLVIEPSARPDVHWASAQLYLLCLNFRYHEALKSFGRLITTTDYGWKLEYDRLVVWAAQIGLCEPLPDDRGVLWVLEPSSTIQMENVRRFLLQIRDECEAQSQYLSDAPRKEQNVLPLHVLRASIDSLWQTQRPEVVEKMHAAMESIILSVDDVEIPKIANYLPRGSRPQLLLAIKQAIRATNEDMLVKKSFQVDQSMIGGHQEWQQKCLGRIRTADHQTKYILTEFVQYDDSWIGRSKELVARINALVSVTSGLQIESELPLLRCLRFCHCPQRQAYGLLFEIPRHLLDQEHMPQPLNLTEVIKKTNSRPKRPALGEVFNLAHTLATSMLSLHKAGWLHKGVSAYNVIFFPHHSDSPGDLLSTVRLIGFNHSRESDVGVFTVGPREDKYVREYQHPDYRKDGGKIRFREEFDYYSLGLVLLELGRWKTLRDMIKDRERQLLSPQDLKAVLLKDEVSQLGSYMGIYYRDAVAACLDGVLSRGRDFNGGSVWHKFDQEVVQRLKRCLAIHLGS